MNINNTISPSPESPNPVLSGACIETTMEAVRYVRDRIIRALDEEVKYRQAILAATNDIALASQGHESYLAAQPDPLAVRAALAGEVRKRLHNADILIPEELYRYMTREPGLPAWTQRKADGGLFYLGKAWAIEEATCGDFGPLVRAPFLETL